MNAIPAPTARWVLLRGLTREARHWGDFPAQLQQQLRAADVVTLDLPGNGRLNALTSPTRVQAMVSHCRAALLQQGSVPPYHLLAMSLGAMVAIAWAAEHPDELAGCVLINTSARTFSPWHQRLRWRSLAPLLWTTARRDPAAREAAVLAMTTHHPTEPPARLLAQWIRWRLENPVSAMNTLRQLLAAARFEPPSHAPAVPLLVLAGAADALVDPRCSLQLAHRWGAELRTHPSAGHDLALDDGRWVAEQVGEWLAARDQAPRKCFL